MKPLSLLSDPKDLTFVRCSACGEPGTWDESSVCPDCQRTLGEDQLRRQKRDAWTRTLAEIDVPPRYREIPKDVQIPPELMLWRGDPWCVVIHGPTGSGKTWAATRLLAELHIQTARRARWVDALDVVQQVRALRELFAESSYLAELCTVPLLLLDDIGGVSLEARDASSRTALLVLCHVLRERDAWKRPTILTSNLDLRTWARQDSQMLEPIASRLAVGIVRELRGADRRLGERNEQR